MNVVNFIMVTLPTTTPGGCDLSFVPLLEKAVKGRDEFSKNRFVIEHNFDLTISQLHINGSVPDGRSSHLPRHIFTTAVTTYLFGVRLRGKMIVGVNNATLLLSVFLDRMLIDVTVMKKKRTKNEVIFSKISDVFTT
jgi:hypothetical protein